MRLLPVARSTTIKTAIAVSTALKLHIDNMDIHTAYVQSEVEEEIFMHQPSGFEVCGKGGEKLVCRLKKSLCGLKKFVRTLDCTVIRL